MPYIKQIGNAYKDGDAVYDLVNYCLNHDLKDYCGVNLPMCNDILQLDQESRKKEIQNIVWFWNCFLDINCHNYGKRLNHFVFGIGYKYHNNINAESHLIIDSLEKFLYNYGLLGIVAYHVNPKGYHHIHVLAGMVNIYGDTWYDLKLSEMSILWYLKKEYGYMEFHLLNNDYDE